MSSGATQLMVTVELTILVTVRGGDEGDANNVYDNVLVNCSGCEYLIPYL